MKKGKLYLIISDNGVNKNKIFEYKNKTKATIFIPPNSTELYSIEPETHVHPKEMKVVAARFKNLVDFGWRIYIITNNYLLMKWLSILFNDKDILYITITKKRDDGKFEAKYFNEYLKVSPNWITEAYDELHNREILETLGV